MSCLNFKKLQCFFEQILNQFWMMLWSSFLHKCLAISFNKFLCDWKQWFLHLPMVALIINFQWLVKNGFDTFYHDKFIFTSLFKRAFVFLSVNFHLAHPILFLKYTDTLWIQYDIRVIHLPRQVSWSCECLFQTTQLKVVERSNLFLLLLHSYTVLSCFWIYLALVLQSVVLKRNGF